MKYKTKATEIEAILYDGSNKADVEKFLNNHCAEYEDVWRFICWWENGTNKRAHCGNFIIKLPDGKSLIIWCEVFDELFEPVKQSKMKTIELEDYDLELILEWAETSEESLKRDLEESWDSEEGYSYFAESKLRDTRELKQRLEKIYENNRSYG